MFGTSAVRSLSEQRKRELLVKKNFNCNKMTSYQKQ